MHVIALVCSGLLIVGCFLPWLQLGALFANRGIDNPDGAIVLVLAIISGSVALFNVAKNESRLRGLYILTALIGIGVGIFDLQEVHNRAQEAAKSFGELQSFFADTGEVDIWNFVGSGLYVILLASIVLLIAGIASFWKKQPQIAKGKSKAEEILCIECGNYFRGEPRFCPHCGKATKFNK